MGTPSAAGAGACTGHPGREPTRLPRCSPQPAGIYSSSWGNRSASLSPSTSHQEPLQASTEPEGIRPPSHLRCPRTGQQCWPPPCPLPPQEEPLRAVPRAGQASRTGHNQLRRPGALGLHWLSATGRHHPKHRAGLHQAHSQALVLQCPPPPRCCFASKQTSPSAPGPKTFTTKLSDIQIGRAWAELGVSTLHQAGWSMGWARVDELLDGAEAAKTPPSPTQSRG